MEIVEAFQMALSSLLPDRLEVWHFYPEQRANSPFPLPLKQCLCFSKHCHFSCQQLQLMDREVAGSQHLRRWHWRSWAVLTITCCPFPAHSLHFSVCASRPLGQASLRVFVCIWKVMSPRQGWEMKHVAHNRQRCLDGLGTPNLRAKVALEWCLREWFVN